MVIITQACHTHVRGFKLFCYLFIYGWRKEHRTWGHPLYLARSLDQSSLDAPFLELWIRMRTSETKRKVALKGSSSSMTTSLL